MDTLTHALSGALLARATAPQTAAPESLPLRRRLLVGFAAAAAPDIDFLLGYLGPIAYLTYHRGVTHSLILLPLWAFLLARLCAVLWRRDRPWPAYFGVIAMALALHIAGDWITSFGTMVFAPFVDERYALGTTFIIDLWFTGIIAAALVAAWVWRRSAVPAVAGMALLAGYVAFQGVQLERALDLGRAHARSAGLPQARVTAQARPVSPFNWMVIVGAGDRVDYAFVNLVRREPLASGADAGFIRRLDAPYLPLDQAQWVRTSRFGATEEDRSVARAAWEQPGFRFFRWFAAEPVLFRVERYSPVCAWFQDLRFFTPGRDTWPFRYGMCREPGGGWRPYQLAGQARVPLR